MKAKILPLTIFIVFCSSYFLVSSQEKETNQISTNQPNLISLTSHDSDFLKNGTLPEKSFYQSKEDWQTIIDTTWGPGDSFTKKKAIFYAYSDAIKNKAEVMYSLELDFDSLKNHYFSQITDSTSQGAFSALMSRFALDVKGGYNLAYDKRVINTPLNPGVPVLIQGTLNTSIEHFGAVTTTLNDGSNLVLRVAPNHPLNLEPGDVILGYEGVPWKNLADELFDAGLPVLSSVGGCPSAANYHRYGGAGMNWHLFETMDILKYSNGETVNLSVLPLLELDLPQMVNNEQLAIPNIPFPEISIPALASDKPVTYGILENTNIGYIFRSAARDGTYDQFYNALKELKNTDALIIDLRYHTGTTGYWSVNLDVLFNETLPSIRMQRRCINEKIEICKWNDIQIESLDADYYDKPISVLIGPSCIDVGEKIAHELSYHPMVRFFGASSYAQLILGWDINSYPDWILKYADFNASLVSEPDVLLNRKEFPIDIPVWFNKDDVAKGVDPVVQKSLDWINNLAYGHSINPEKCSFNATGDTVLVNTTIENPNSENISAMLIIESLYGTLIDSTEMVQTSLKSGANWQAKWIPAETTESNFWLSVKVNNHSEGTSFTNRHMTQITNRHIEISRLTHKESSSNEYQINTELKNLCNKEPIHGSVITVSSDNPWVKSITPNEIQLKTTPPGRISRIAASRITIDASNYPGYIDLKYTIAENGWSFWELDTTLNLTTSVEQHELKPLTYKLEQNYPNPVNSSTNINWQIPQNSEVILKVLDIVGRTVRILVNEERPPGEYETLFDASGLPKGIYFYQLNAGDFIQTRKMILK